jgi:signal transduction histidine kinase
LVAYPMADGELVDATGAPVTVAGLQTTTVERGEDRVVVLAGSRRLDPAGTEVGVALAWPILAIELESAQLASAARRLAVARRASLEEADRESRLLGRDLHDGAQQQLVSLMIGIRVTADRAGGSTELESALTDIQAALDDVRRISHGDLPEILLEQGLEAALRDLAAEVSGATVALDIGTEVLPDAVRNTAYLVVAACLARGVAGPSSPTVRIRRVADLLEIRAESTDPEESENLTRAAIARVRTLGGRWSSYGHRTEVDLPCA